MTTAVVGMPAPPAPEALRAHWRATGLLTDERLGWAVERAAERWPHRVAAVDEHEACTFTELRDRSSAIARTLVAAGVGAGDVVSWSLPNRVDTVAVAAAIWRIGAISNPVVTIYRGHEFGFILGQLRPAAVITCAEFRGRRLAEELDDVLAEVGHGPRARLVLGGGAPGWVCVDRADPAAPLPRDVVPAPADEPCLILYTSGTTASPKGAVHSSGTLLQEVRSMQREWALTWRDVMFMASPLTHITGLLQGLLVPASVGARLVLAESWDAARAVERIEAEGATYMAGATPFLQGIVEEYGRRGGRPALRQYCCGGAEVPSHLIEEADRLGIAAYRAWGMTEFPTTTLASENDPLERRATTDGRRAEGVEIEAVDEDRRPLPGGAEGELRVRGPECMLGYVDRRHTAEALDGDGWLYTGDLGTIDEGGWVRITGRIKDIINRGGEKFSAREIEDLLAQHPSVAEVAVVGVPGGRLGERVCAAVVARDGASVGAEVLARFLLDRDIARQKIPEEFRTVDALPRTAAGKVQKFRVTEMLSS